MHSLKLLGVLKFYTEIDILFSVLLKQKGGRFDSMNTDMKTWATAVRLLPKTILLFNSIIIIIIII